MKILAGFIAALLLLLIGADYLPGYRRFADFLAIGHPTQQVRAA